VKVGDGSYSQDYGFGCYDPNLETNFLQIYLEGKNKTDGIHKRQFIPASNVVVGDLVNKGEKVRSISDVKRRGVYSPLSPSGDIVVSGIHASNYVNVLHRSNWFLWDEHTLGHTYQYPQ
jgi:Hint module